MKFGIAGVDLLRCDINEEGTAAVGREREQDFIRRRKMGMGELVHYILNKRGLCTNMETNNFFEKTGRGTSISAQALFDQRLKLNPEIFRKLNTDYLKEFYSNHQDEVKTYRGFVLKAIDGSDIEIPHTKATVEKYGIAGNAHGGVARASASVCFDVLNHFITDGITDKFRTGEIDMAMKHIGKSETITTPYKSIYIMDRNYVSISFVTYMIDKGVKFLCRLKAKSHYFEEIQSLTSSDEIVYIKHTKNRLQRSRFANEELFQMAKAKGSTRVRIVSCVLRTGEIEYLITNIEDFTTEEIVEIYSLRWGIETMYFTLKHKLQIEKFTSGIAKIIEQDFLSGILVYNIAQAFKNEAESGIEQGDYKHEMKVNENMAIGLLKNELIRVMLEDDGSTRVALFDALIEKIRRFKVPVRKGRRYDIAFKSDNLNSFNKLKAF